MSRPRLVAVTGATGFVGTAVVGQAARSGCYVAALTRGAQPLRNGVEWVPGSLEHNGSLARLVRGAEAVIHIAGLTSALDAATFEAANVVGTLNVLEAALAEGVPRFVFVSSLSAREPGLSDYGASKARAEQFVKAAPIDWTIVRPPAIYGPHDKEMFELFRTARWGFLPMPAEGRASVIHADDLARLLLALVPGGPGITSRIFEPDDGRANGWSHYELARAIGWAVGRRPKVIGLSKPALERAAVWDRRLRGAKAKLTPDRAAYFSHPDWVVSTDARPPADLWQPRIETREGLMATAKWYRANRWF